MSIYIKKNSFKDANDIYIQRLHKNELCNLLITTSPQYCRISDEKRFNFKF